MGTFFLISLKGAPMTLWAKAMFSYTFLSFSSLKSWKTMPSSLRYLGISLSFRRFKSLPFTITSPSLAVSSLVMSFKSVDFPAPDLPVRNTNSPSSTLRLMFLTALTPFLYSLLTFLNSIILHFPILRPCANRPLNLYRHYICRRIYLPAYTLKHLPDPFIRFNVTISLRFYISPPAAPYRKELSVIYPVHVIYVLDHHKRDLKGYGVLKYPQVKSRLLLQLVKPVHKGVPVYEKLP